MFDIRENLKKLPAKPGVYIHKDQKGQILYVGKALSLKNRVRQYFQSPQRLNPKIRAMVGQIAEFEYIVTDTEMEALLLESLLIKRHKPKYNAMLRDDKTFPWIKVTLGEDWPRLEKTRRQLKDGSEYFGPYTDVTAMHRIIDLLADIYALKRCRHRHFPSHWKPCLNYHIGKCRGVCINMEKEARTDYLADIDEIVRFLTGDTMGVVEHLTESMTKASDALDFETAAAIRNQIQAIQAIPDQAKLDIFLADVRRNRVKVVRDRAALLKEEERRRRQAIIEGFREIGFKPPNRVEAYDISHIAGNYAVGAMVVFQDHRPVKQAYRRFRIKTALGSGDTDSLQEVIYRRLKKALAEAPGFLPLPDLILVDGGQAQVNAVNTVLEALQIDLEVAGMVKTAKHRTRGLVSQGREIDLKSVPALYRFISAVQEEVHRFAISYHRQIRSAGLKKSELDNIPGIGPKRRQALFTAFRSIEAIAGATVEELSEVPGMNRKAAEEVKKHLNNSVVER
ncbi:MAG TPA: excinuclease ABC subunit UvrC [Clostridiales bacterium]|nr:excinuclease ABC subunit UvrC [Clostridiales bacterium]